MVGVIGIFIGLVVAGAALVLSGVFLAVMGLFSIFGSPLVGLLVLGVGFILAAVGLLLVLSLIHISMCIRDSPKAVRFFFRAEKIAGLGVEGKGFLHLTADLGADGLHIVGPGLKEVAQSEQAPGFFVHGIPAVSYTHLSACCCTGPGGYM